jgi:hypothetical protein
MIEKTEPEPDPYKYFFTLRYGAGAINVGFFTGWSILALMFHLGREKHI